MNQPAAMSPVPHLVDGVDVDAVAAAVRSCPDVDDLDGGPLDAVASYLPGRRVAGVRVAGGRVTVQLRSRWGVPVPQVGRQVHAAVSAAAPGRTVDIVVSDIADPPATQPVAPQPATGESEVVWTPRNDGVTGGPSSAITTPTGAVTPMSSSPVLPPSTTQT